MYTHIYYFHFSVFLSAPYIHLWFFYFIWRKPFVILLMCACYKWILCYCLPENVSVFLLLLMDIFAGHKILGWQLFPFDTLNTSFHYLQTFVISVEKSIAFFIAVCSTQGNLDFSLQPLRTFFLSLVFSNFTIACQDVYFFTFILLAIDWDS